MCEYIKFEVKNEKNPNNFVKSNNNLKNDLHFEKHDNRRAERVHFPNNLHTVIVPTHHTNAHNKAAARKNATAPVKEEENRLKSEPKNISKLVTVNDTKNDFVIHIKNDTHKHKRKPEDEIKHKRKTDTKHTTQTHATLSSAESKTSLRSDHRILIKSDSKSTLRSGESKGDLKSLSGTLPRHEAYGTVKGNSLNRSLHKVDSKATLKSETVSTTDISIAGSSGHTKKSLESMTDEEIIEENLKELLENKNRVSLRKI